jgi:hypothetical protein
MPDGVQGTNRWRLNTTLLKQAEFCQFIRDQIKFFCETSCPSSPISFVLWDTLKAFLRGQTSPYTKGLKNKCTAELNELKKKIIIITPRMCL